MKIQDLLRKDVMLLDLQATEKKAVIEEMIQSLVDHGYVTDFETFKEGILAREALTSTGLWVDGCSSPGPPLSRGRTDGFAKPQVNFGGCARPSVPGKVCGVLRGCSVL